MGVVDPSMTKRLRSELLGKIRAAKIDDYQIYACTNIESVNFIHSPKQKRHLLARAVLPAAKGDLCESVIFPEAMEQKLMSNDGFICPKSNWFSLFVEAVFACPVSFRVFFFLPPRAGLTLPGAIQVNSSYHLVDCHDNIIFFCR